MGVVRVPGFLDVSRLAAPTGAGQTEGAGHAVQFYEGDAFLVDAVSRFVGAGLDAGDGGVVIATRPHLDGIEERLRGRGPDAARGAGRYVALDAAETLSRIMDGGWPEDRRFAEVVGGVIALAARGRSRRVRVFGEMVALLWAAGKPEAAIRLEELWNDLVGTGGISLLCAYPMSGFGRAADDRPLLAVCAAHTHVLPAESYAALPGPEERLRTITRLQQKAAALEAEIEERRALERLLRRREEELSDFLENAAEGLHRAGPDGIILWANRAEMDLLGYAPEEYIGHHVAEFHVDREVIDDILQRLRRGETLRDRPARLRCRDGSIKHVILNVNALREGGRLVYTRCFTRDVTDRVEAERALADMLAREQAARAEAEAAVRAREAFLARASHELRTPLTSALGTIRLLERAMAGTLDEAPEELIAIARRNMTAMLALVNDLLDASKLALDREPLAPEPVDLAGAVAAAFDLVGAQAREKGVALRAAVPERLVVSAEPVRLEQVLVNLLGNAVKFTPAGGEVVVEAGVAAGGDVEIRVRDTGEGILAEHLERVFEPLFRGLPRAAARRPGDGCRPRGTGLGLTICRQIVLRHGGQISAESDGPGRGATFTVRLPAGPSGPVPAAGEPLQRRAVLHGGRLADSGR